MLPAVHRRQYIAFQQALKPLIADLEATELANLVAGVAQLQQIFQQQLLPLPTNDLDPTTIVQVQSLQTEMHKQLQLLKIDASLLQAARRPETIQQRQGQIRDRLQTLLSYCSILLQTELEPTD